MLLTHWFCDRRILHLSLHVHDHSGVVLEVDEDALLLVPRLPLKDHHHGHHLLREHRGALLHEAHTRDVKPRHCDLVQAASDALHGHDGKVLVARVVRTIHDAHTDVHLELDFVLVIVLDLVLSESLPAVGCAPCPNVRPWLRQGLGCPRADPRVQHRTFSHVLRQNFSSEAAHHTPSHRLRLAEPPHALSRATRGLGDPSRTLRKTPPTPGTVSGDK